MSKQKAINKTQNLIKLHTESNNTFTLKALKDLLEIIKRLK